MSFRLPATPRTVSALAVCLCLCLVACGTSEDASTQEDMDAEETTAVTTSSPVPGVSFRTVELSDVTLRVAEQGEGPLVLLVHGWPESWYSWRHQLPALAEAGYRAIAPDMRGYGGSDAPPHSEDYDIRHLCADLDGLVSAYGEEQAVLVGHDWGAVAGWMCALLTPDRYRAVVNMSVPYGGRAQRSPLETWKETYGDNFFYILYFQEIGEDGAGVAEAEFDADPRAILSRLYTSPDTPREAPAVTDPLRAAGGWIPRLGAPTELPPWLSQQDLDYYVSQFEQAGFRGGISYYRNFHRNWEITPELDGALVPQPALFIAGERDGVIGGADQEQLEALHARGVADLRGVHLIEGAGHWVQQEEPEQVNALLIEFLGSLD